MSNNACRDNVKSAAVIHKLRSYYTSRREDTSWSEYINHPIVNEWNTANDNKHEGVDVDNKQLDEKHKRLDVKHAKLDVNNAWLDH